MHMPFARPLPSARRIPIYDHGTVDACMPEITLVPLLNTYGYVRKLLLSSEAGILNDFKI